MMLLFSDDIWRQIMFKTISIILFILSLLTPIVAFMIVCAVGDVNIFGVAGMTYYLWIMIPFSIVPLISLCFGIIIQFKHLLSAKKNIIAGSIVLLFMVLIGLSSFSYESDQSGSFLEEVSQKTGIRMPSKVRAMSSHNYGGRVGNALLLDDLECLSFEYETKTVYWEKELSVFSAGILPSTLVMNLNNFNSFLLYVEPIDMYNPKELDSGKYELTFLAYAKETNHLLVFDCYGILIP